MGFCMIWTTLIRCVPTVQMMQDERLVHKHLRAAKVSLHAGAYIKAPTVSARWVGCGVSENENWI